MSASSAPSPPRKTPSLGAPNLPAGFTYYFAVFSDPEVLRGS